MAPQISSVSPNCVVLASPEQISCQIGDEAVLLSTRDGQYYGLNEVGARIWRLVQKPRSVAEIADAVLSEYSGIERVECEQQVMSFVTELARRRLIDLL